MMEFSAPDSRSNTPPTAEKSEIAVACVLMAAGFSRRFGATNKLLASVGGRPLLCQTLDTLAASPFCSRIAVVRIDEMAALAYAAGFEIVQNREPTDDPAVTIALGLSAVSEAAQGCLFAVGDQPLLSTTSVRRMLRRFAQDPSRIVSLGFGATRGNPMLFPRTLFAELSRLPVGKGGRALLARYPDRLSVVEATCADELYDTDTPEALECLRERTGNRLR